MMKFVLLLVTICALGNVLSETHDQQMKFADRLVEDIQDAADSTKEMLKNYDENTEEAQNLIFMHANAFTFNLHYVLDCLQYLVVRTRVQSTTLQEIVLNLNDIAYELEGSFKNGVAVVKSELQRCVEDVVVEAQNIRKIVRENNDHWYRTTVLQFLDDLTTATQDAVTRNEMRRQPKVAVKSLIRIVRKILTSTLDSINSANPNVHKDIARYSAKFASSAISQTKADLRDLTLMFKTNKVDEIKEIIYSLSKIVRDNDEVLHNENSFENVKNQLRVTIVNFSEQLNKMVDVGYSDDQTLEDETLIYIIVAGILNEGNQMQRNFEKTIDNYIRPRTNE